MQHPRLNNKNQFMNKKVAPYQLHVQKDSIKTLVISNRIFAWQEGLSGIPLPTPFSRLHKRQHVNKLSFSKRLIARN